MCRLSVCQGCYFCVKQYALECSRIPMGQTVNSQVNAWQNSASHVEEQVRWFLFVPGFNSWIQGGHGAWVPRVFSGMSRVSLCSTLLYLLKLFRVTVSLVWFRVIFGSLEWNTSLWGLRCGSTVQECLRSSAVRLVPDERCSCYHVNSSFWVFEQHKADCGIMGVVICSSLHSFFRRRGVVDDLFVLPLLLGRCCCGCGDSLVPTLLVPDGDYRSGD